MEIVFAKAFRKLLNQDGIDVVAFATLLSVLKISDKSQLSHAFIEYDTDLDYNIADNCPLLILIFLKPSTTNAKNIFITVRTWSEEKEVFYKNQIGKDFNIAIRN